MSEQEWWTLLVELHSKDDFCVSLHYKSHEKAVHALDFMTNESKDSLLTLRSESDQVARFRAHDVLRARIVNGRR